MAEIITLVVDIALGALAYRQARANRLDLAALRTELKAEIQVLRGKVDALWLR